MWRSERICAARFWKPGQRRRVDDRPRALPVEDVLQPALDRLVASEAAARQPDDRRALNLLLKAQRHVDLDLVGCAVAAVIRYANPVRRSHPHLTRLGVKVGVRPQRLAVRAHVQAPERHQPVVLRVHVRKLARSRTPAAAGSLPAARQAPHITRKNCSRLGALRSAHTSRQTLRSGG